MILYIIPHDAECHTVMAVTSPHLPLSRYLLLDHVTRHVGLQQLGLPEINMLDC